VRRAALLALLAALALPAGARAIVLPTDSTVVLSGMADLQTLFPTPANDSVSTNQALGVRSDGELLAVFSSRADGLVADDDDTVENVYVKDVTTGAVQLVSRQSNANGVPGEPSHADCENGAISADAHAVAFLCTGSLDPARDANGKPDVYVRNLDTGQTALASRATDGNAGDGEGVLDKTPAVAHDAASGVTSVVFQSSSTNLVSPPAAVDHLYRRTLGPSDGIGIVDQSGAIVGDGFAEQPSISADGQRVVFTADDRFDAGHDANNLPDVYLRDFGANGTPVTLMSRANGADGAAAGAVDGAISPDGTTVAFSTNVSLDAADVNGKPDVYLRTGATTALATPGSGCPAAIGCVVTSVGGTGANAAVAIVSGSGAFGQGDPASGARQAYVSVLRSGARAVDLVSRGAGNGPVAPDGVGDFFGAALSPDGAKVALSLLDPVTGDVDPGFANVALRDLASGAVQSVSRPAGGAPFVNVGTGTSQGDVSADGRYAIVKLPPAATGLPANAVPLFRRDLDTGELTLVTRADGPQGAPLTGNLGEFAVSGDGRRVAFALGVSGQPRQVYVRDIPGGRTLVASRANGAGGALGDGDSELPSISADGARVAFASHAKNLVGADDADAEEDVFVRELDSDRTLLADRAAGAGAKANLLATRPAISGDGRFVAFLTHATNLDATADTNDRDDVYVRGVDDGSTRRASVAADATQGDGDALELSISRDGGRVAFRSSARNLGGPAQGGGLYLKDLRSGALTVAARANGPGGTVADGVGRVRLSADGQHVAFSAAPSTSLVPGVPNDHVSRVYERDLASGVTRLISRRSGAAGAAAEGFALAVTADGGCVLFGASGLAATPPGSPDSTNVFMRVVEPNCGRPVPSPPPTQPVKPAVLSRLSVKPSRFFVVVRGRRGGGAKIAFRLDKGSLVTLSFDRLLPAHRKGKRCLTTVHKGKRCTVIKRVGHLTVGHGKAGADTVKFSGKLGRKALAPGSYRLTATPLHGRAVSVRFTVVKAPKPKPKAHR
jgi:Tol biopolymer transport system component